MYVCAKCRWALLQIKKALGIFRELIPRTRRTTTVAFWDPPSVSKKDWGTSADKTKQLTTFCHKPPSGSSEFHGQLMYLPRIFGRLNRHNKKLRGDKAKPCDAADQSELSPCIKETITAKDSLHKCVYCRCTFLTKLSPLPISILKKYVWLLWHWMSVQDHMNHSLLLVQFQQKTKD